jgi:beta-glucosidase
MKKLAVFLWIVFAVFCQGNAQSIKYPYQNSKLSVEERVKDLLGRMSLEEKVRQMDMYKGGEFKDDENFSITNWKSWSWCNP